LSLGCDNTDAEAPNDIQVHDNNHSLVESTLERQGVEKESAFSDTWPRKTRQSFENYAKNSNAGKFVRAIWNGTIQESHYAGIPLVLIYEGTDGLFNISRVVTMDINLAKLVGTIIMSTIQLSRSQWISKKSYHTPSRRSGVHSIPQHVIKRLAS